MKNVSINLFLISRKFIFIPAFFLLFAFCTLSCNADRPPYEEDIPDPVPTPNPTVRWELVFQDDFNGTEVNQNDWYIYHSPGHAGNGLRRASAFSVSGGILTVTAQMIEGQLVSGGSFR